MTDARALQVAVYGLLSAPAVGLRASQVPVLTTSAGETSTGLPLRAHQVVAYALVKGLADRNDLRAWPFVQDDHIFYVLQLGAIGTIVLDILSQQWASWVSPDFAYWRGNDGTDWEGYNLCCDTESGIIWKIDPTGRLDYTTDPIRSQATGMATVRFRRTVPNYMAELSVSEGKPPTGIDATTVGITLRTSDDGGQTFLDHGTIDGEALGEDITVRWFGLGLMVAPGRVFEIVDTGYARRIDGLDCEFGGNG